MSTSGALHVVSAAVQIEGILTAAAHPPRYDGVAILMNYNSLTITWKPVVIEAITVSRDPMTLGISF